MKVRDVGDVSSAVPGEPVKAASTATAVADKVSADQAQQLQASLASIRASAGSDRNARLLQVAAAVRGGTYRPNPNRIADQILESAELEARIRAMLAH